MDLPGSASRRSNSHDTLSTQQIHQQMRRSASGGIGSGGIVTGSSGTSGGGGSNGGSSSVSNDRKTYQPPIQDTSLLESPSLLDIESRYL